MAMTRTRKETILTRAERDPVFREELLREGVACLLSGDVDTELNNFPFIMIDPATVLDEKDKWDQVWTDLFLRR